MGKIKIPNWIQSIICGQNLKKWISMIDEGQNHPQQFPFP